MGGGTTWEPEREQETSFGGMSIREEVCREHVKGLYRKLSEITCQTSEAFHFNTFELSDGELYYEDKSMSLMTGRRKLRSVLTIVRIFGKEGLHKIGFD